MRQVTKLKKEIFSTVIEDVTAKFNKIKKEDYLVNGNYPILDQGQQFIGGYTDDATLIYDRSSPFILFGDHTKTFKYVDFPFTVGADGVKVLKINEEIADSKYVYYFLKTARLPEAGYSRHFKFLKNLSIPLPEDLKIQRQIAHLLSRGEELIAARQRSLALLDDFLKSTFIYLFGDPVKNEKGWKRMRLEELADITSGVTKNTSHSIEDPVEIPYMRVANVQDNKLDLTEIKTIEVSQRDAEKYLLHQNDILLTEGGDPDKLGRGVVWNNEIEECIHQNHIFRVRVYGGIEPHYLCSLIGSRYGKNYFLKAAKQTTGIASINSTQLKNFPAYIPDAKVQATFGRIVNHVESLKTQQRESLTKLQNLYQSLLQRAFAGELDVSTMTLPEQDIPLPENYHPPEQPKIRRKSNKQSALKIKLNNAARRQHELFADESLEEDVDEVISDEEYKESTRATSERTILLHLNQHGPISFEQINLLNTNRPYHIMRDRILKLLEENMIVQVFDVETNDINTDPVQRGRIKFSITSAH